MSDSPPRPPRPPGQADPPTSPSRVAPANPFSQTPPTNPSATSPSTATRPAAPFSSSPSVSLNAATGRPAALPAQNFGTSSPSTMGRLPEAPPFSSSGSGLTRPGGEAPFSSSPSGLLTADATPAKRRAHDVVQWLHAVRRTMEPVRQYTRHHPLSIESLTRCVSGVMTLVRQGELQLDVGPNTLHFEGQQVPFGAQGTVKRDPLATTLFNEGVRRITFLQTVTDGEAAALLSEWIDAATKPHGGNVASIVWELEPKGLKLVLLDTFEGTAEGGDGTGLSVSATGQGRSLSVSQQIDSLVSAISAEGLAADGGGGVVSQGLIQVSADDIALLRSEALRGITANDLAAHETSGRARSIGLEPAAAGVLRDSLDAERNEAFSRLGPVLLNAAVLNTEADWPLATALFGNFVRGALSAGQFAVPLYTWQRLVAETRSDPILGARRVEVLKSWKAILLERDVMEALVYGLDTDARDQTLEALKVMGKAAVPVVLKFASTTKNEAARRSALAFVREVDPTMVASAAANADPTSMAALVSRLPTLPDAEARDILEKLLSSMDVTSRRIGAKALNAKRAPLLRHQLVLARLQDNDMEVRVSMLRVAIALEDPSTLPALLSLAKRPRIDSPELELLFEAIAVVDSKDALAFIENELANGVGARRIAAAAAVGGSSFTNARELLNSTAAKLLSPPALKAACRTALERLSKRGIP